MADATVTNAEIEALRFHLGYGNIAVGGYPYTPDGFLELFAQVIQPNLTTAPETTAATATTAGAITVVTPASMTGIAVNGHLVIDVGDDAEEVVVKAVTVSTFTARFAKAHEATGYPVALASGVARLRLLLWSAETAWKSVTGSEITATAGIQSVGKGEVVWFEGNRVLRDTLDAYKAIVSQLSRLVRVEPVAVGGAGGSRTEAY